jgi:hypothetical protein
MRLVYVESPYAAATSEGIERNLRYARAAMADCLRRGEAPFASHLLYTQPGVLDDAKPEERALGMRAGFEWASVAEATVVYIDLGISPGMKRGIEEATYKGRVVEERSLPGWEADGY